MQRHAIAWGIWLVITMLIASPSSVAAAEPPEPVGFGKPEPTDGSPGRWIQPDTGLEIPGTRLAEVDFDGLPIGEIARFLLEEFDHMFDVILPREGSFAGGFDPAGTTVSLRLRNVTAPEVFDAMNLLWDAQISPLHWDLRMNGTRPVAVLRVEVPPKPVYVSPPPEENRQAIFFVGDVLGDEEAGGLSMGTLLDVLGEITAASKGARSTKFSVHKGTELLIVTGTADSIAIVTDTLVALRERAQWKEQKKRMDRPGSAGQTNPPRTVRE